MNRFCNFQSVYLYTFIDSFPRSRKHACLFYYEDAIGERLVFSAYDVAIIYLARFRSFNVSKI